MVCLEKDLNMKRFSTMLGYRIAANIRNESFRLTIYAFGYISGGWLVG